MPEEKGLRGRATDETSVWSFVGGLFFREGVMVKSTPIPFLDLLVIDGDFFTRGRSKVRVVLWTGEGYVSEIDELMDQIGDLTDGPQRARRGVVEARVGVWAARDMADDVEALKGALESLSLSQILRSTNEGWSPIEGPPHEVEVFGPLGAFAPAYWPLISHPRAQRWVNKGPTKATLHEIVRALNRVQPSGKRFLGEKMLTVQQVSDVWVKT
jgi:hypothetical protein